MSPPVLRLGAIRKRFAGVRALDGVDLTVAAGEIHCLVGENGSGKSTLIQILAGNLRPEPGGVVEVDGRPLPHHRALDSIRHGIEVIYQDLSLFPNLSVAENVAFLQQVPGRRAWARPRRAREIAARAMARVGVALPLDAPVGELSVGEQQLVAIARALTGDLRLLVMDEPTAALTAREVAGLLRVVQDLRARGISVLFVSHRLDEILEVADRVTVLRDGVRLGTFPRSEVDEDQLRALISGRAAAAAVPPAPPPAAAPPLLEVRGLRRRGAFSEVSLTVSAGEVLGLTGRLGAGRTELARALFGVDRYDAGQVRLGGAPLRPGSVRAAVRAGLGYLPENRLTQGLALDQPVGWNAVVTVAGRLAGALGLLRPSAREAEAARWVAALSIKAPSLAAPVRTLSGGNQQRVVLAKWLATRPRVLVLDGPTVGVDVGAKAEIHAIVRRLAAEGVGVLVISDEAGEIAELCSRALVMAGGRIAAELRGRLTAAGVREAVHAS